jgi:hypothetical protein
MRTTAALEGSFLVSVARWCGSALLVAAFTVIVVDMMTICLNGSDSAAATSGRCGVPQEAPSRQPGTELPNKMLVGTSESNLSVPDTEGLGIGKALNAGFLTDDANQPVFNDWLRIDPYRQTLHGTATGVPLAAWIVPTRSH